MIMKKNTVTILIVSLIFLTDRPLLLRIRYVFIQLSEKSLSDDDDNGNNDPEGIDDRW